MIRTDFHVHTSFSSDSDTPMEQMIEAAIDKGLEAICFTEHMDYHYPETDGMTFVFDPEAYHKKIDQMQLAYGAQIQILRGVELGLSEDMRNEGEKLLKNYPFDFVIGSQHLLDHKDPYYAAFWEGYDPKDRIRQWYQEMARNIEAFPKLDTLGHLDYISRYIPGGPAAYASGDFKEEIDAILREIICHDICLEINTNAYRYDANGPHPLPEVIQRYFDLGGKNLTIGSDAHVPEHLAQEYDRTEEILRNLGAKGHCIFSKRKRIHLTF
ncbi:MAG: histidinol-phosphatase HisJ family protein [Lachnospiraceae bacterium]|nr:histidinol-phosphatase HisJ family protein [Lachnospiraceae bacterium]